MKLRPFLEAIRTETLGFGFGSPWRYGENSTGVVLPILREDKEESVITYLLLVEAKEVEIVDTGKIDEVQLINKEELPVFIRMGELLQGSTQERTAIISRLIMPGEKTTIAVKCVHAGRGISPGSIFTSGGYSPGRETYYTSQVFKKGNFSGVSQGCSWQMDRNFTGAMKSSIESWTGRSDSPIINADDMQDAMKVMDDDLKDARDKVAKVYKDIVAKVPLLDYQIGIAILDTNGFDSLDCYDIPNSWKVVKEAMVEKETLSLAQENNSGLFEYKPERAVGIVKDVLGSGFSEKTIIDEKETKTITFAYKDHVGEAVIYNDDVIHLLIARKQE